MLGEAVKQKLIKTNPCDEVKELKKETTVRIIMTAEEFKNLFPADWSLVWEKEIVYKANLLAACTGLRIGELRGLRCNMVFDNYIKFVVCVFYVEHEEFAEFCDLVVFVAF